jgi:extradiol dioxygenase family protein
VRAEWRVSRATLPVNGAMLIAMQALCFHLSIPAWDLTATERWYVEGLGCRPGRRSDRALILDLAGHQLVAQLESDRGEPPQTGIYPRHFGLVLATLDAWADLRDRARHAGLTFGVAPRCRFPAELLEHHTFFLLDPAHNWLEFKHYSHPEAILGCVDHAVVGDAEFRL